MFHPRNIFLLYFKPTLTEGIALFRIIKVWFQSYWRILSMVVFIIIWLFKWITWISQTFWTQLTPFSFWLWPRWNTWLPIIIDENLKQVLIKVILRLLRLVTIYLIVVSTSWGFLAVLTVVHLISASFFTWTVFKNQFWFFLILTNLIFLFNFFIFYFLSSIKLPLFLTIDFIKFAYFIIFRHYINFMF